MSSLRHPAVVPAGPLLGGAILSAMVAGLCAMLAIVLELDAPSAPSCAMATFSGVAGSAAIVLAAAGGGATVGATEYGGPGDPTSGSIGSSGINLASHPDSYAELGGTSFQTATAMGGLPYLTPLRVSWGNRSAIAYKRDIGLGGGPIDGRPRAIDLWWQFAGALGIPYEGGRWSGPVRVSRPPAQGAGGVLGSVASGPEEISSAATPAATSAATSGAEASAGECPAPDTAVVPDAPGARAVLLADGLAAAPADAPPAVRGLIAAGNQIAGRPYVYGAAHGLPLDVIAPAYDCSSSVEHLLYGGGMLPVGYGAPSGALESFGLPGPGRWITIYANPDHVFLYVAGLRWDTWNAAGVGDGSTGIGWHPLVRDAGGFVARHPAGL